MNPKKPFILLSHESVVFPPGKKIIPQEVFSQAIEGQELLQKVKQQAEEYRKHVLKECEGIKEQAYQEGFQKGLEKFNEQVVQLNHLLQTVKEEVHQKILPLAIQAAKKILGEELKLHPDRIVEIVMQALKPVMQHHRITIYVNKADLPKIEAKRSKIRKMLEQVQHFAIQEREDIEPGGCIIETEAGIINAQLENQWRALEAAFKSFMGKKQ